MSNQFVMKSIFCFFLFLSAISFAQPETAHWNGQRFYVGKNYVTYGDNLSLREAPNTISNKLAVLPINTKVEVIEVDESNITVFNIEDPWVKVKAGDQVGYIASGYLALRSMELSDGSVLLYTRKQDPKIEYRQFISFRHVTKNGYIELGDFILSNNSFDINLLDNKGLKGMDNVLDIQYLGESCGEESGRSYLIWDLKQKTLQSLGTYSTVGDGGMYHMYEELIFPTDEGGIPNTLIYNGEEGESEGDEDSKYNTVKKTRKIAWVKGKTQLPIPSLVYQK